MNGCPAFKGLCKCVDYRPEDEKASARCVWYKPYVFAKEIIKCPIRRY